MEKELTQDFKILPSSDHIDKLIEKDAEEVAEKIQNKIVDQIEGCRGSISVRQEIPDLYRSRVIAIMKKWVKLYDYNLEVDGYNFSVFVKNRKPPKTNVCNACLEQKKKWRYNILGFVGLITGVAFVVSLNYGLWFSLESGPYMVTSILVNGIGVFITAGVVTAVSGALETS